MNEINADNFWNRLDFKRGKTTLKSLTESLGIEYETIRVQRTRHRFPKPEYMYLLAQSLDVSVDYLLTGKSEQKKSYSKRIEYIADKLSLISDQNLLLIENTIALMPIEDKSMKVNVVS